MCVCWPQQNPGPKRRTNRYGTCSLDVALQEADCLAHVFVKVEVSQGTGISAPAVLLEKSPRGLCSTHPRQQVVPEDVLTAMLPITATQIPEVANHATTEPNRQIDMLLLACPFSEHIDRSMLSYGTLICSMISKP
jgi:hypothetical protein